MNPLKALAFLCVPGLLLLAVLGVPGTKTIGPFDNLRPMVVPSQSSTQPWDVLQVDAVLQFYAWRDLVLSSWQQFTLPAWNPFQLAGTPLLANSQSGGLYPLHILLGIIGLPASIAINLLAALHLVLCAAGCWFCVRRLGGTHEGGVFAGFAMAFSAFVVGWLALPSVLTTLCWAPWLMGALAAIVFGEPSERPKMAAVAAGATAMMILGGHLQFVAYGMLAAGLGFFGWLVASIAFKEPSFSGKSVPIGIGLATIGVLAGVLLAGPQLLPVLQYSEFSHRRGAPTPEGYQAYVATAMSFTDIVSRIANPFAQGHPVEMFGDSGLSTFWPGIAKRGENFAESAATLGIPVLLLLAMLPFAKPGRSQVVGLALVAVVSLLLAAGTPLNAALYFGVPGWSATGSPARVLSIFVLSLCLLSGLCVTPALRQAPLKSLGLCALGVLALVAISMRMPVPPTVEGFPTEGWQALTAASQSNHLPMFLLASLVSSLLVYAWIKGEGSAQSLVCFAPLAFSLIAGVLGLLRSGSTDFLKPIDPPSFERVAHINENWELLAAAPGAIMPPNLSTAMRIHELGGYDSLLHRDTVALLHDIVGQDSAPPANGNMMFVRPSADPAKLADAGVTKVVSMRGLPSMGATTGDGSRYVYMLDGPGRVSLSNGTAEIVNQDLDSLDIRVSGSGTLFLRDRNLPGWSASVDGEPVTIAGSTWREVEVPPGSSVVTMRYSPPGFGTGILMTTVGVILCIALLACSFRKSVPVEEKCEVTTA